MQNLDFHEQLAEYERAGQTAVNLRHQAAVMEIERSQWVALEITSLIAAGRPKTVADKEAHASDRHRQYQKDVAELTFQANEAEARARALYLALRWEVACREGVTVDV